MLTYKSKLRIIAIASMLALLVGLAPNLSTYSSAASAVRTISAIPAVSAASEIPAALSASAVPATLAVSAIPAASSALAASVASATSIASAIPVASVIPSSSAVPAASSMPAASAIPVVSAASEIPAASSNLAASAVPTASSVLAASAASATLTASVTSAASAIPSASAIPAASVISAVSSASAVPGAIGSKPYMGWSSWSLEATTQANYGKNWLNEKNVKRMSDYMHSTGLQAAGYTYINIDAGWWSDYNWNPGFDSYGRPVANSSRFPGGISGMASYVHSKGQKLGVYFVCGLDVNVYNANYPIYGTSYHAQDIAYKPLTKTNGWKGAYAINWSHAGAQAYINSIANQFAAWGVDFVKLDGVTPSNGISASSTDNRGDVKAWSIALKNRGRSIWYTISWSLDHGYASTWKQYANGMRIDTDVESYGTTLVTWGNSVDDRFYDLPKWLDDIGNGAWADLDSLNVGCGQSIDGISNAERQSYMTLWVIASSPLYIGDDLGRLDSYGKSLLTNPEVIAVNQSALIPKQIASGNNQVWASNNPDGSYNVALFNLSSSTSVTTVNWSDLGFSGSKKVRDLWSRSDLGNYTSKFSARLAPHGSRFIKVYP